MQSSHRDFDELFFFAGAYGAGHPAISQHAAHLKFAVRPHGAFWSVAVNPSVGTCVRELRKLFDRAFHKGAFSVALATADDKAGVVPFLRSRDPADRPRSTKKPKRKIPGPHPNLCRCSIPVPGKKRWKSFRPETFSKGNFDS